MIDIVIPYKQAINSKDTELRYALRSIQKHLTGYGTIYLMGDKPEWTQNIIHTQVGDIPSKKQRSICKKIMTACQTEEVSDRFIMWHDDYFILKPLHVNDFQYWRDGTIEQAQKAAEDGRYRDVITALLNLFSPGHSFFDIHTPIFFEKKAFVEDIGFMLSEKKELPIKTTYCLKQGIAGTYMKHLKIVADYPFEELKAMIKDRLFFSTGSYIDHKPNQLKLLEHLYPEKSRYEK